MNARTTCSWQFGCTFQHCVLSSLVSLQPLKRHFECTFLIHLHTFNSLYIARSLASLQTKTSFLLANIDRAGEASTTIRLIGLPTIRKPCFTTGCGLGQADSAYHEACLSFLSSTALEVTTIAFDLPPLQGMSRQTQSPFVGCSWELCRYGCWIYK